MLYQKEIDDSVLIQFIILFTLSNVDEPVRYDILLNLIMENCNINYTDLQVALDNLVSTDHVSTILAAKNHQLYEITPKGKYAGDFFKSNIPIYIREPILESIEPLVVEERRRQSVQGGITPLTKKEFLAECALYDDDRTPLMNLSFYAGSREQANKIVRYYKEHPDTVYQKIVQALTEETEEH